MVHFQSARQVGHFCSAVYTERPLEYRPIQSELIHFVPHITCWGQALEESATFTGLPALAEYETKVLVPMGMT